MSKNKVTARVKHTPVPSYIVTVDDLASRHNFEEVSDDSEKMTPLSPDLLRAIIVAGPYNEASDLIDDVVSALGEKRFQTKEWLESIKALLEELEKRGSSLRLQHSPRGFNDEHLADAVFEYGFGFAQAGYLVGLAVGRQMGGR